MAAGGTADGSHEPPVALRPRRAPPPGAPGCGATVDVVEATNEHCDNCASPARDSTDVAAVHRVYLTPAAWDTEEKIEVLDEVEHWCSACRSVYPHQELPAPG